MKRETAWFGPASLGLLLLPALTAIAQTASKDLVPRTYGTKDRVMYRITASEFSPINTLGDYGDDFNGASGFHRKATSGIGTTFFGTAHLPAGALVDYLELDYCDTDAGLDFNLNPIDVYLNAYDCNYLGSGCSQIKSLKSSDGSAVNNGCGYVSDSSLAYTIDNYTHEFMLTALLYNDSGQTSLAGAIVGYHLQVSPPSGQTFADVPPNYPFYKAIQALAASGITSGCGNGNFCPNQPVTRGEMAKFLANALGLRWTN